MAVTETNIECIETIPQFMSCSLNEIITFLLQNVVEENNSSLKQWKMMVKM